MEACCTFLRVYKYTTELFSLGPSLQEAILCGELWARAMTEARSAPVFVSRTPARFGQSVWDAVGMTSCRGLFYDEQARVELATSVDELCKCFQVWKTLKSPR